MRGHAKILLASVALLGLILAPLTEANTPEINIHHGRIWHTPGYDGADGWNSYIIYPGGYPVALGETEYILTRQWNDQTRKGGTYFMSTDFVDPANVTHPNAVSYMFRSMDYSYPWTYNGSFNYVWPLGMIRDIRWARPTVTTNDTLTIDFAGPDGLATPNSAYPSYASDPRPPFTVKSDLVTEMASEVQFRYVQGVKIIKRVYSYPQGTPHQDYVIHDITLTNDGVHGDPDALPGTKARILDTTGVAGIPAQTITNALWYQSTDIQTHAGSGGHGGIRNDQDGMFIQPWPGVTNAAAYTWDEDDPGTEGPDYGDPGTADVGEIMVGNAFIMSGPLFVSEGPGAAFDTNIPGQPLNRKFYFERAFDLAGGHYPADMDDQRLFAAGAGLEQPLNVSYQDHPVAGAARDDPAGPTWIMGFGPSAGEITDENASDHGWDLAPGESVRIVNVLAAGGIDVEEGRRISQIYNSNKESTPADPTSWMAQSDIDLYMTGKDSVTKAVNLAYWNFTGSFASGVTGDDMAKWGLSNHVMTKPAAQNQPFNVPEAPRPPGSISVSAPQSGGIVVKWTNEAEGASDFDTGVNDFMGYRVYRQEGSRSAPWEIVVEGAANGFAIDMASADREFTDANTAPAVDYWYAVVSLDDGSQNWADPGVVLESGRWWTWSGFMPGTAVTPKSVTDLEGGSTPSGVSLTNTPNPFNPTTVVNFTLDRTEEVTLRIFDLLGREVKTLVDAEMTSSGSHRVAWNGVDSAGREVASGLYMARLVTPSTSLVTRMVLIR